MAYNFKQIHFVLERYLNKFWYYYNIVFDKKGCEFELQLQRNLVKLNMGNNKCF